MTFPAPVSGPRARPEFVRGAALAGRLMLLLALGACGGAFDPKLLEGEPEPAAGGQGGVKAGSGAGGDRDAGLDAATGGGGSGSHAGAGTGGGGNGGGGGAKAGSGGSGGSASCRPNPDTSDESCPSICPETCNGEDDDCDGAVDEDEASDDCALPNASSFCQRGTCLVVECEPGFRDCNGDADDGCEVPSDDIDNCGDCGTKCRYVNGVAACVDGECERASCEPGWDDCDEDDNDCETAVVSNEHCGQCGRVCSDVPNATPSCATGVCGPGVCLGAYGDCNGEEEDGCEIDLTSLTHCGGCDQSCDFVGSADVCIDGTCFAAVNGCEPGYDDCDGKRDNGCEALSTNDNCGACGEACDTTLPNSAAGTQCVGAACTLVCAPGYGDCDDDPQTGCETPLDSLTNCGACKRGCARDNAVATCATGACQIVQCSSTAYDDCNGRDNDGCEADLTLDATCGSCLNDCKDVPGLPFCSGGACGSIDCTPPMDDCNGEGAVCETDLSNDVYNCGVCGNECAFTDPPTAHASLTGCVNRSCTISCDPGYGNCDGNYANGCEVQLNSTANCDACNETCAVENGTAQCTTWSAGHYLCKVATCDADYGDCDGDETSCETKLDTPAHCNACTTVCSLTNAVEACVGGSGARSCAIAACDESYYEDCNGQAPDGCEIDTRTNVAHCGACDDDCRDHANVASATCASSACSYTCDSGYRSCDATPGCETNIRTLSDCGGCDVLCSRLNATATCTTGSCQIASCNPNHDDCDGSSANGCEPLNTLVDCGSCNAPLCSTPNATPSCTTGSCQVASCNANYDNCDASPGNGCERDIRPPAMGGFGPCVPDTNCTKLSSGGHDYFFCANARTWSEARARCQLQLAGDLVQIDDAAENTLVKNAAGGDAWIGASDATTEGNWRWVVSDVQFWSGAANGSAVGGRYNNWEPGSEPNDNLGKQDCGVMWKTGAAGVGTWDDEDCAVTRRFVCEVADLCPNDPLKTNPLQCGCGTPDVHGDADGIADCNETCDADPDKLAPGLCGCGTPDTNADGDAQPDCFDECDADPSKVLAGQCGCNVADSDFDGDGAMDCVDGCPYDKNHVSAGTCGYDYTPSNFLPGQVSFSGAPDVVVNCNVTLDSNAASAVNVCGASIVPVIVPQGGGVPDLWILPMASLSVAQGSTLKVTGGRPAVLAVAGNATVSGTIDVSALGNVPGAGGDAACAVGNGQGTDGVHDNDGDDGDGGGGGGGFGSSGSAGGAGDNGASGQAGGAAVGAATLVPLRGGCRGGSGGTGGNVNGAGSGGGAIQLAVGGRLTVGGNAVIAAAGSAGRKGGAAEESGGGGGSGGAILLEAYVLSIDANAWITANGGAGAGGNSTNTTSSASGTDGLKTSLGRAPGGAGANGSDGNDSDGGGGGQGAALNGGATTGANASDHGCTLIILCGADGGGGGGGGGGVGRIRIHGIQAGCSVPSARVSPAASVSCP